jgi:hypothetical protein
MACTNWNDDWIAHLYGELEPEEVSRLEAHLGGCADCRATLDELQEARRMLAVAAPEVPTAPRVVVRPQPRLRQPIWAFASGLAAAAAIFAVGLLVGMQFFAGERVILGNASNMLDERSDAVPATLSPEELERMRNGYQTLNVRLDRMEQLLPAYESDSADAVLLTSDQFQNAVVDLNQQFDLKRTRDVQFLLQQMVAIEARAREWDDETRRALRYLQVVSDPRFQER